jgi:hypothetical protein
MISTTGTTGGVGTDKPSVEPVFTSNFSRVSVIQYLVLCGVLPTFLSFLAGHYISVFRFTAYDYPFYFFKLFFYDTV